MAEKLIYECASCGARTSKWQGRCFECGEFGVLEKKNLDSVSQGPIAGLSGEFQGEVRPLSDIEGKAVSRFSAGISGVDYVLGGGIVPGSVVLLAGGPGLGKSTLLLQVASLSCVRAPVLYVSAEESAAQIRLRAERLGVNMENISVLAETDVRVIAAALEGNVEEYGLAVVDSVQALSSPEGRSFAGSVSEVRRVVEVLSRFCKRRSLPLFLIGHVTKKGSIAGPKTLEHMVDAVFYLEGDSLSSLRFLRSLKNRFGSISNMAVFQMTEKGLEEVIDPSAEFLQSRKGGVSGSVLAVALEGMRPLMLEVQALTTPCGYEKPTRNVTGIGFKRLLMLLAVLRKRAGIDLSRHNVFVNVSGGMRVREPGVDLPVCLALVSSVKDTPLDEEIVSFGEVGLLGELKSVARQEERAGESRRMGFERVISPDNFSSLKEALKGAGL